ncbi:MAG TPA: transketolase C-terminal domain-containing protein, partial [Verrucomicrobiales bacterium]|nr:transketolase C-terminal domain-containing protein [Verrucomicrobiales bacterium]
HQPVETVSGLRVIPNLDVIRPGDAEETAGAFAAALLRQDGPTALILSRQNVPNFSFVPVATRREGATQGGYVILRETSPLETILIATGSELALALAAAEQLGSGTRVVSMPCVERFDRQSADYRDSVLPTTCTKRLAIEAGVSGLWHKYVGLKGRVIGVDRFGLSAPGDIAMVEVGITVEHLVAAAREC